MEVDDLSIASDIPISPVDNPQEIVDSPDPAVDSDSGDESPDVEIMERLTIKEEEDVREEREEREEDGKEDEEMTGLRKQRDKLRETLEQRQVLGISFEYYITLN